MVQPMVLIDAQHQRVLRRIEVQVGKAELREIGAATDHACARGGTGAVFYYSS